MHRRRIRLNKNFWRLWSATAVSSVGDGMVLVALPLLALRSTHDPIAVGGVFVAGRLPAVLVALPAGALADRTDRRRLLVGVEVARMIAAGAVGLLVLSGHWGLEVLYAAALVLGGLTMVYDVVAGACLPAMVTSTDLMRANAHLVNVELLGEETLGQAVGGAAVGFLASLPFLADAASFLGSAVLLRRAVPSNKRLPGGGRAGFSDVVAGLRYFAGNRQLRSLTMMIASFAFCQAAVLGVFAVYASEDLHLRSTGYGILLAIASVGNLIGASSCTRLQQRLGAVGAIGLAGVVAAAAYPLLASTSSTPVAAVALMAESAGVVIGNVGARTLRQSSVPPDMQGRAASAYQMTVLAMLPLGALVGGAGAGLVGVRGLLMAVALPQLCAVGFGLRRLRALEITEVDCRVRSSDRPLVGSK